MMNTTTITNITPKDQAKKQIRILVGQKNLFPVEERGAPKTYDIQITHNGKSYPCTYRIGSADGKSRSGVLRLHDDLAMMIKSGQTITLKLSGDLKYELSSNTK